MKMSTSKKVTGFAGRGNTKNVTGLNTWGGVTNNENARATKGFAGKTPDMYACDMSNEQPHTTKGFKSKGGVQYARGGDGSDNENVKGWKQ